MQSTLSLFYKKKTVNLYGWLYYIIIGLKPFYSCEDPVTIRFSKFDLISYKTLMEYKKNLTKRVEAKISGLLPNKFSLVFDGWFAGTTHYIAVFATMPSENSLGYEKFLLVYSPMLDETSQ